MTEQERQKRKDDERRLYDEFARQGATNAWEMGSKTFGPECWRALMGETEMGLMMREVMRQFDTGETTR